MRAKEDEQMALITTAQFLAEGHFTAGEFDWDDREQFDLAGWGTTVVALAGAKLRAAVGATTYASTNADTVTLLTRAEMCAAMVVGTTRRIDFLAGRPEEAPPPEYIDVRELAAQIERYRAEYDELVGPFRTDDSDQPGTAFCFEATGVDETETDDYTDVDYDNLEDA